MKTLIIICGNNYNGKTTLARSLAENNNYNYIDFDYQLHDLIQNTSQYCTTPIDKQIEIFILNISKIINSSNNNLILDGWFSWQYGWETHFYDNLQLIEKLKSNIKIPIEFYYCFEEVTIHKLRWQELSKEDNKADYPNWLNILRLRTQIIIDNSKAEIFIHLNQDNIIEIINKHAFFKRFNAGEII
jgi:adenylate kinase family enzyme